MQSLVNILFYVDFSLAFLFCFSFCKEAWWVEQLMSSFICRKNIFIKVSKVLLWYIEKTWRARTDWTFQCSSFFFIYRTLEYLFRNKWLDDYTRTIFVEFTVYNANVNLFCIVTLLLETAAVGKVKCFLLCRWGFKRKWLYLPAKYHASTLTTPLKENCSCWCCRSIPVRQQTADCATVPVNRWPPRLCHGCWDHIHDFYPVLHVCTGKKTYEKWF